MLFYAYLFKSPNEDSPTPYVIYAASQKQAERKFEKRFGKPGIFVERQTW